MMKFLALLSITVLAYPTPNVIVIQTFSQNNGGVDNQTHDDEYFKNQSPDERTLNSWMVKIKSSRYSSYYYGLFIGPRQFLTLASIFNCSDDISSIDVYNDLYNSWPNNRNIHVDLRSIYFNLEFNRRSNISPRDVALLITDEPVIPIFEITENTFKKVASDVNNVDLTKCFIQTSNTSTISFYDCHVNYPGDLSNDNNYFLCSIGGYRDDLAGSNSFFCNSNEYPHTKVLVGLATSGYHTNPETNVSSKLILNVCGLKTSYQ